MLSWPSLPATFTTAQAREAGVHPRELYRRRDANDVVELSRGVFRQADAPEPSKPDLLAVSLRTPGAVVCLVSAASVHDLTDEMPQAVQIAVPRRSRPPRISYPPTECFQFNVNTFELGISREEVAEGESVRVYDSARTVVDLMRFRGRLGPPLALGALRRYLASAQARPGYLLELASALDVLGPVRSAVDVLESA